jgi:alpha-tubulin suppressor-like RCC1 family protein
MFSADSTQVSSGQVSEAYVIGVAGATGTGVGTRSYNNSATSKSAPFNNRLGTIGPVLQAQFGPIDFADSICDDNYNSSFVSNGVAFICGSNEFGQMGSTNVLVAPYGATNILFQKLGNYTQISVAFSQSTILLAANGTIWSLGRNNFGQLGSNSQIDRSSPVQIGSATNWTRIKAGTLTNYFLNSSNQLWGVGVNTTGELGQITAINKSSPVQISSDVQDFSAGSYYTMFVKTNGTLWGTGYNNYGMLGNNSVDARSSPVQIGSDTNWSKVFCGVSNTFAIKTDGTLWGWGQGILVGDSTLASRSSPVQIGSQTYWKAVFPNKNNIVATTTSGVNYAWGSQSSSYILPSVQTSSPVQVTSIPAEIVGANPLSLFMYNVKGLQTSYANLFYTPDAFYINGIAQADTSSNDNTIGYTTIPYAGPNYLPVTKTGASFAKIAMGFSGQLATGAIGQNASGYLGCALGIKTDGTLWAWGGNTAGSLGDGTVLNRSFPVQIGAGTTWSKISTAASSAAIKTDGTMWTWGYNLNGSLGQTNRLNRSSPVQVGTLTNWAEVSINYYGFLAVKTDGTLWACGLSNAGILGVGTNNTYRSSPVQVGALTNWSKVSLGSFTSGAIKTDGTLWMWGFGQSGILGTGNVISRSSPVQIGADTNWSKVVVSESNTYAIKTNGTLWGWGQNNYRQIDATGIARSSPVQIGSATNWIDIAPSYVSGMVALNSNGEAYSMGIFGTFITTFDDSYALTTSGSLTRTGRTEINSATYISGITSLSVGNTLPSGVALIK